MSRARSLARKWAFTLSGLGLLLFMLWRFEHSQVYHPDRVLVPSRETSGLRSEDVWFTASDGTRLNGWFFPHESEGRPGALAILYCHGNAGNISHRVSTCRAMVEAGASVLAFDYRGYGASEGRPGEKGTYLDAQAAWAWLRARGFERVVAFGESLGGGVAAELALREPVAGLVLQSTFTSIPAVGAELFPFLPVRWLSRIKYATLSKLGRIHSPVMVMHGRGDTLIRFHHAEKNFAAANEPKLFWELAGDHNDALADERNFVSGLGKFLLMCANHGSGLPRDGPGAAGTNAPAHSPPGDK